MPAKGQIVIALVTAPNLKAARKLARAALTTKLAACVNIVPRIESHYWWKGKLEQGNELLLVIKSIRKHVPSLQEAILKNHPYDTAEFIVIGIESGSERYLRWITSSLSRSG
jgi:periplasmic divalent cation tolerance protein